MADEEDERGERTRDDGEGVEAVVARRKDAPRDGDDGDARGAAAAEGRPLRAEQRVRSARESGSDDPRWAARGSRPDSESDTASAHLPFKLAVYRRPAVLLRY